MINTTLTTLPSLQYTKTVRQCIYIKKLRFFSL
jgi:hypothetical protein